MQMKGLINILNGGLYISKYPVSIFGRASFYEFLNSALTMI